VANKAEAVRGVIRGNVRRQLKKTRGEGRPFHTEPERREAKKIKRKEERVWTVMEWKEVMGAGALGKNLGQGAAERETRGGTNRAN